MPARPGLHEVDRDALVSVLSHAERAYERTKAERRVLHQQEWEASSRAAGSVLGEAEMRTDAIFGIVRELLSVGVDSAARDTLDRAALVRSRTLQKWLHDEATGFPEFAAFLAAVEHLRALALRIVSTSAT